MADIKVISEPLTYEEHAPHSYFRDLALAESGDNAANVRLIRHAKELKGELERRDKAARSAKPDGLEYRTNPSRTTGQGGYAAPPLWLIDKFATAPRAPRVLANLIPGFPLPQGVQSVNIPRLTTGAAELPVPDLAADPMTDIVDAAVTSQVVTISGHGDVSMQLLEQSPAGGFLDFAFFKDLSEAYDAQLEAQLISGSGTNGQLTGLLNVTLPTANTVTYTDATPTAAEMAPSLGQAIAAVGNNRKLPPELWLMTTSRLAWLASSEDNSLRPLFLVNRAGSGKLDMFTFAVEPDDAIPTNQGASGTEDRIIACRPSDLMLFESEPRARVELEVLSGTLQARIHLHTYAAALTGRYPTGTAFVKGTGMIVQTNF
jgi:HK97 family phage major capsid protein